jgi:hypothetical protein
MGNEKIIVRVYEAVALRENSKETIVEFANGKQKGYNKKDYKVILMPSKTQQESKPVQQEKPQKKDSWGYRKKNKQYKRQQEFARLEREMNKHAEEKYSESNGSATGESNTPPTEEATGVLISYSEIIKSFSEMAKGNYPHALELQQEINNIIISESNRRFKKGN